MAGPAGAGAYRAACCSGDCGDEGQSLCGKDRCGHRHGCEKFLWAGNVTDQIGYMKALWESFPEDGKPEWLTMERILNYEKDMLALLAAKSGSKDQMLK